MGSTTGQTSVDVGAFCGELLDRFIAETPAKLWLGCFVVGIALEYLFGDRPRPAARQYLTNLSHSAIYLAAIFIIGPSLWCLIALIISTLGFQHLINLQFLDHSTVVNQIVMSLVFLFVVDLFQYWWHRAQHRFEFLWDQHIVHHSDEALNVTTAARHHWTEFILQAFTVALPLALLFDVSPAGTGVVAVMVGALQFYLHSNLRIGFGRLSWLFGSPQHHRMHHSILPQHQNRNFAACFPLWDVLFGTFQQPGRDEFPPTGVAGVRFASVLSLTTYTFTMWGRRLQRHLVQHDPSAR